MRRSIEEDSWLRFPLKTATERVTGGTSLRRPKLREATG